MCAHISTANVAHAQRRRNDFLMKQDGEKNREEEAKIKHKNATKKHQQSRSQLNEWAAQRNLLRSRTARRN